MIEIAVIAVLTIVKWLVYTALLWLMIKVQKMQYNVLGLLGSSALATLLNFIPVVGCYVSWAALILCLWKVTHEDIVPDVIFTVGVAGALMFCLNLWVFAVLIGDFCPSRYAASQDEPAAWVEEDDFDPPEAPPQPVLTKSNAPSVVRKATAPITNVLAKGAAMVARVKSGQGGAKAGATAQAKASPPPDHGLALKGVMLEGRQPSAWLKVDQKLYSIEAGEELSIPSAEGTVKVRCDAIERTTVSVTLNDSKSLVLRVH